VAGATFDLLQVGAGFRRDIHGGTFGDTGVGVFFNLD